MSSQIWWQEQAAHAADWARAWLMDTVSYSPGTHQHPREYYIARTLQEQDKARAESEVAVRCLIELIDRNIS